MVAIINEAFKAGTAQALQANRFGACRTPVTPYAGLRDGETSRPTVSRVQGLFFAKIAGISVIQPESTRATLTAPMMAGKIAALSLVSLR